MPTKMVDLFRRIDFIVGRQRWSEDRVVPALHLGDSRSPVFEKLFTIEIMNIPANIKLTPTQIIQGTLIVALISIAFWLLIRFHVVVLLLFLAIIISTILKPAVRWLHRKGLSLQTSTILIYLLVTTLIVAFLMRQTPRLLNQANTVTNNVTTLYASIRSDMTESDNVLLRRFGISLPIQSEELIEEIQTASEEGEEGQESAEEPAAAETNSYERFWETARTIGRAAVRVVFVVSLAYFWTLEEEQIIAHFLLMVPLAHRAETADFIQTVTHKIEQFAIGQTILCVTIGALSFVLYLITGLPDAFALAILAGVMEAIPIVGPTLGAIPALVVALTLSPTHALWVIVGTVIIQQLENSYLVPRVMDKAIGIHPLITLLSLVICSLLFNVLGALVAIPLAVVTTLLFQRYLFDMEEINDLNGGRDHTSVVRYETQQLIKDIRKQVRHKSTNVTAESDELEDLVESIALDLDSVLAQNETTLSSKGAAA